MFEMKKLASNAQRMSMMALSFVSITSHIWKNRKPKWHYYSLRMTLPYIIHSMYQLRGGSILPWRWGYSQFDYPTILSTWQCRSSWSKTMDIQNRLKNEFEIVFVVLQKYPLNKVSYDCIQPVFEEVDVVELFHLITFRIIGTVTTGYCTHRHHPATKGWRNRITAYMNIEYKWNAT